MSINPLTVIKEIFAPAAELVDNLHTSDEERLQAKQQLLQIQTAVSLQLLEYEQNIMESKHSVIIAEATSDGWLQKNWRPVTMITFLGLAVADSFGWLASPLAPQAWTLLQVGLGGYVIGRSAEKAIPNIMKILSSK